MQGIRMRTQQPGRRSLIGDVPPSRRQSGDVHMAHRSPFEREQNQSLHEYKPLPKRPLRKLESTLAKFGTGHATPPFMSFNLANWMAPNMSAFEKLVRGRPENL